MGLSYGRRSVGLIVYFVADTYILLVLLEMPMASMRERIDNLRRKRSEEILGSPEVAAAFDGLYKTALRTIRGDLPLELPSSGYVRWDGDDHGTVDDQW
jgi:hypothetical protein